MKEEEMTKVNLRINGNYIPLLVPPHVEPMYRDAEKILDKRALQLKKENELDHLSGEKIALLLAIEALIDALQLKKENVDYQKQIDDFLEMLGKTAA